MAIEPGIPAILIDEKRGRLAAKACGLIPVGTLNILNSADLRGLLDFEQAVAKLCKTSFRADPKMVNSLIQEVRARKKA